MKFNNSSDKGELNYGLVLTRLPHHEWWHGHFGRSSLCYDCEILGRATTILFVVQKFGRGGTLESKRFYLTLDGEGIADSTDVQITFDWGERSGTIQEKAAAMRIRQTVVPLLQDYRQFQKAVWFVVDHLDYETVADLEKMQNIIVPPYTME